MDYLIVVLVTLACVAAGWYLKGWALKHRPEAEVCAEGPQCAVCDVLLPKNTTRDAVTGGYRCGKHKGVAA